MGSNQTSLSPLASGTKRWRWLWCRGRFYTLYPETCLRCKWPLATSARAGFGTGGVCKTPSYHPLTFSTAAIWPRYWKQGSAGSDASLARGKGLVLSSSSLSSTNGSRREIGPSAVSPYTQVISLLLSDGFAGCRLPPTGCHRESRRLLRVATASTAAACPRRGVCSQRLPLLMRMVRFHPTLLPQASLRMLASTPLCGRWEPATLLDSASPSPRCRPLLPFPPPP